jgi:acyl-CoA-binding protein
MTNFDNAAQSIKDSANHQPPVKMADDELLQIYSLFKQGTVGDNNTDKPGMLDFKGKAKWEAWNKLKGKSKEQAQTDYIELARTLLAKYNVKPSHPF